MNAYKTEMLFDNEAQDKVIIGVDKLYRAVSSTLGPRSRSVGISTNIQSKINKDGVSVAKSIFLEDEYEYFGVKVVREAAQKTVDQVGDATTCTIILAHAFIHECLKQTRAGIVEPMALRKPLETEIEKIITRLDALATPIKTLEQKINIATISASGDRELGELIAKTLDDVGDSGVVTVQESRDLQTKVEKQDGMQLEYGLINPFLATDPERGIAVYENTPVLITDKKLDSIPEIGEFIKNTMMPKTNKLVIIAPDVSPEVLEILINTKMIGQFQTLFVKSPSVGSNQLEILQDICALTGATLITRAGNQQLNKTTFEQLGLIGRIVSSKQSTIISEVRGHEEAIKTRLNLIDNQLKDEDISDWDKEKLKERKAKLTSGVAVIRVGGATEIEMKDRKEKTEDALGATKAAIREGVVIGGEMSLILMTSETDNPILKRVLESPFRKLVTNSGYEPAQVLADIRNTNDADFGFDVTDGKVKMLVKEGIIDPVACIKSALRNALSVAIQIVEMGTVIVPLNEDKK